MKPLQANVIDLKNIDIGMRSLIDAAGRENSGTSEQSKGFLNLLKQGINDVNSSVKQSEQASMDLVSGRSSNIHETMLAASKAELGMNLLVQLRNKAIESYQEIMRMQV